VVRAVRPEEVISHDPAFLDPQPVRPPRYPPDSQEANRARPALEALEDRYVPSILTVTSSADDVTQNHTLRHAVAHAQNGDTIQITEAVKAAIVLTHGELLVSQDVTILSVPARTPTISGNSVSRVFEIAANVALQNLNITGSAPDLREPFSFKKVSRAQVAAAETDGLSEIIWCHSARKIGLYYSGPVCVDSAAETDNLQRRRETGR
jgi:hypothetical protein